MFRWTLNLKGGPTKPIDAAVAVDHRVYAFGWYCTYINERTETDVYVFNTLSLHWTKLPPGKTEGGQDRLEHRCYYHTAVLVVDNVFIWGGYPHCNAFRAFDVENHRWSTPEVSGAIPEARFNHSACVLGKAMYIYGGQTQLTGYTNDIYKLDTTTMVWALIKAKGTPATASEYHSATIIGKNMFVFGGHDQGIIRVFDTENECWLQKPSEHVLTKGSRGHKGFAYNGELYILGGDILNKTIQKFNPETFSWKTFEPKGKSPVWKQGMCFCMVGHCIFAFGGYGLVPEDMYVLDFKPCLKTLCKLAVTRYHLGQSGLPHNIRWEMASIMSTTVTEG